jgi:hypothetical protein
MFSRAAAGIYGTGIPHSACNYLFEMICFC